MNKAKVHELKQSLDGLARVIDTTSRVLRMRQMKKEKLEMKQRENERILQQQLSAAKQKEMSQRKKMKDLNEILYLFSGRSF